MKKTLVIITLISFIFTAFKPEDLVLFQKPRNFPSPVYDFSKNPLTKEKADLGRALFYDNILSKNNTISCASCHSNYNAFAHTDHALSHGIHDSIGTRNAPALINLAWQKIFMWDGAVNHLDMQALAPIHNKIEMDERIENVVKKLQATTLYPAMFYKAYKDSIITGEHILKAMSAFMLTLVSANSKYDSVKNGYARFNAQEQSGHLLFSKHCNVCHKEPLFTNYHFDNNGLKPDPTLSDIGRMAVTKNKADSLKFKIPTLRNIEFTYPYMHDGRFKNLNEVINHYTSGILQSPTLSTHLQKPIQLTPNEKVDLIAFLLTLSDREFIFNAKHAYPRNIFFPQAKESK